MTRRWDEGDLDGLRVERDGGVVTLTIDRPERKNAITGEMWQGVAERVAPLGIAPVLRLKLLEVTRESVAEGCGKEGTEGSTLAKLNAVVMSPVAERRQADDRPDEPCELQLDASVRQAEQGAARWVQQQRQPAPAAGEQPVTPGAGGPRRGRSPERTAPGTGGPSDH